MIVGKVLFVDVAVARLLDFLVEELHKRLSQVVLMEGRLCGSVEADL